MKRGFTQTLMMVAVVLMAAQAMAMAPVIKDIPSPVVGDAETVTPANTFVYPDAIDLSKFVTDDNTTNTSIKWYYETVGVADANKKYRINGVLELTTAEATIATAGTPEQVATLPAAKVIAGPGAKNLDTAGTSVADQTKITIRNNHLSPISGPNIAPDGDQTQLVTLYASDGETVAAKSIAFYTAAGNDHLSPSGIPVVDRPITGTANGFTYQGGAGNLGHTIDTNGLCLTVGASGDNSGLFNSPFSDISLVKNNAYRIRLTVNGTQTAVDQTPIWDVLIDNIWIDPSIQPMTAAAIHGKQAYGADFWMYDGTGGENAWVQFKKGDVIYDFWWTPAPVLTARWNDAGSATDPKPGLYSQVAAADDKDAYVRFRMIDYRVANAPFHADQTQGKLCLKRMEIERYDLSTLTVDPTPVWQASAWTVGNTAGSAWNVVGGVNQSVVPATGGGATIKAAGGSGDSASFYAALCPGDANLNGLATAAAVQDDYPCPMDPKTLYKITVQLSAPTQADQDNPVDAFWISSNMMTSEEIQESYVTAQAWAHGMPSVGTPQEYVAFFYSNYGSNLSQGGMPAYCGAFRPYFAMTNNKDYIVGAPKTGAIKVSSMKVEKVTGGFTN